MGKPKAPRRLEDNEARAVLRTIRISPQKLNLVATLIRGKKVAAALNDLEFSQKRIAGTVRKTLQSSIAMKRFHSRGRGRASRVEKPFSHLTIVVREVEEQGEAA